MCRQVLHEQWSERGFTDWVESFTFTPFASCVTFTHQRWQLPGTVLTHHRGRNQKFTTSSSRTMWTNDSVDQLSLSQPGRRCFQIFLWLSALKVPNPGESGLKLDTLEGNIVLIVHPLSKNWFFLHDFVLSDASFPPCWSQFSMVRLISLAGQRKFFTFLHHYFHSVSTVCKTVLLQTDSDVASRRLLGQTMGKTFVTKQRIALLQTFQLVCRWSEVLVNKWEEIVSASRQLSKPAFSD